MSHTFHDLIGAARNRLSWRIPKHYTAGEATRLLRNAVMHGGELPTKDSAEFRLQFDKWRLFLLRLVLIRLGYSGEVVSPYQGVESSSRVDDFSVEHNSYEPHGPAATALTRFCRGPSKSSRSLDSWPTTAARTRKSNSPRSFAQSGVRRRSLPRPVRLAVTASLGKSRASRELQPMPSPMRPQPHHRFQRPRHRREQLRRR